MVSMHHPGNAAAHQSTCDSLRIIPAAYLLSLVECARVGSMGVDHDGGAMGERCAGLVAFEHHIA
eukprot:1155760-Pelagomonas_calceolata.AAC.5